MGKIFECDECNDTGMVDDKFCSCRFGSEPKPEAVEITEGQYLVGYNFNPGGLPEVDHVKQKTADLMDMLHVFMLAQMEDGGNDAAGRCAAVALSKYEEACMWAVKALTKPPMGY